MCDSSLVKARSRRAPARYGRKKTQHESRGVSSVVASPHPWDVPELFDVVGVVTKESDEYDLGNTRFGLVDQPLLQFVFGLLNPVKVNRHLVDPPLSDDTPVAGGVVPSEIT